MPVRLLARPPEAVNARAAGASIQSHTIQAAANPATTNHYKTKANRFIRRRRKIPLWFRPLSFTPPEKPPSLCRRALISV